MSGVVVGTGARAESEPGQVERREGWTSRVGIAAGGTFLLILAGSIVHNLYFPGWPLMQGGWVPDLSNMMTAVHFLHRLLAAVLLAYLLWLVIVGGRIGLPVGEKRLIVTAGGLYLLNVGLGAAHVFTMVDSAFLVAAHLGLAAVVWSLLVAGTTMSVLVQRVPDALLEQPVE